MCSAGRNRSALLNALIVAKLLGISGQEAVEYVQRERPNSLANPHFVKFLIEEVTA
jgi:protein-tyrosine phosphatase